MPFVRRKRTYYRYGTELDATVVGSPTIVDGVVSGFTKANYLLTTKNFTSVSSAWEAVAKITTGSDINTLQFVFGNGGVSWRMSICVTEGRFAANLSSNNSSWNIASTSGKYTVLANTNYWVKLKFTGTQYVLEYSVDGVVWNEDLVIDNSTPIYNSDLPLSIGANKHRDGVNYPFLGSIDLQKSYIKINGEDWWRGTKAVESTTNDYDYYVDIDKHCNLIKRNKLYNIINPKNYKTLQINAIPNDAVITINNKERSSIIAVKGSKITWSVKAEGYASQSGIETLNENTILNITLNSSVYEDDQVVFENATAGAYEVEIAQDGNYEVYCIGGGGGGAFTSSTSGLGSNSNAGGGSGSGFIGVVKLLKNIYSVTVGVGGTLTKATGNKASRGSAGGNSSIGDSVIVYGGSGGYNSDSKHPTGGAGGAEPLINVELVEETLNISGNTGSKSTSTGNTSNKNIAGGASVYEGYGKGGTSNSNGTAGYVKIVWKG